MRIAGLCLLLLGCIAPAYAPLRAQDPPSNPETEPEAGSVPVNESPINVIVPGGPPADTPEEQAGPAFDMDVDVGANAAGAVDVDVSNSTDADLDASGVGEAEYTRVAYALPETSSSLPLAGGIGVLALLLALAVRVFRSSTGQTP